MTGPGLRPGSIIGRYEIRDLLGAGGMGEVYRAWDRSLDRVVALKVLPSRLTSDPERVGRFSIEAKAASALNHPAVVTVYEVGQDFVSDAEGSFVHYIAMELVEGETLDPWLARKQPLDVILEQMARVAQGLGKAHQRGVVHRDLKPDNIMITADGNAKILDFGLAKLFEPEPRAGEPGESRSSRPTLTQPATMMGTIGYMSPEQVEGYGIDHRTDIFSLGCLLYEAISSTPPFAGTTTAETLHAVVHRDPEPIETIDPRLQRILDRCLAKDRDRRYDSALDLSLDLLEIASEGVTSSSGRRGKRTPPSSPSRRWTARTFVSLLVAGVLIVLPATAVVESRIQRELEIERAHNAELQLSLEERERKLALQDLEIQRLLGEQEKIDRLSNDLEASYRTFLADVTREFSGSEAERHSLRERLDEAESELGDLRESREEQVRMEDLRSIGRELSHLLPTQTDGRTLVLTIPGTAFDTGGVRIQPEGWPIIQQTAEQLQKYPQMKVRVEGHADSNGYADENLVLSQQRAVGVRDLFVRAGVHPSRLTTIGHGEMVPLFSNDTRRGRVLNRRVEIVISY